jgi:hypothetical protein
VSASGQARAQLARAAAGLAVEVWQRACAREALTARALAGALATGDPREAELHAIIHADACARQRTAYAAAVTWCTTAGLPLPARPPRPATP